MRLSTIFGRTLRDAPAEAEGAGYRLLLRGGYVRPERGHRYVYLPLGAAALARIAAQFGGESAAGSPLGLPAGAAPAGLLRGLAGSEVQSYRQLPATLAAEHDFARASGQSRGGPLNAQSGPGRVWGALAGDRAAIDEAYATRQNALLAGFEQCGVPITVALDGLTAGDGHAYAFLTADGGDALLMCDGCGYAATRETASFARPAPAAEAPLPLEKIETPHCSTIAELAALLNVPESRTAKAVFLMATVGAAGGDVERFVFAVVRGDYDVSERKLKLALGASALRPATESEIRAAGAEPGYASPVGLKKAFVVADPLVAASPNLVAGANEAGYHLLNTNLGRDYQASVVADIVAAPAGACCTACGEALRSAPAAILGRSAKFAPAALKETWPVYLDATGRSQPILFAIHEVDLGATLAAVAERHGDAAGLALPAAVAPFAAHLVLMQGAEAEAAALHDALESAGLPCLLDDRNESPGVKFTDADLIGLPLRITLGKRSLQAGGAEFKLRDAADKVIVPLDAAVATAAEMLGVAQER
ncbi:MAG: His/Gly/Thr/Pro-type tRNA ligase C-terminal domain-containing protein [Anaerolineae bacterium]|nr:His/Gly/Thr/Pro-type tRNA ligase C-terminal domain-containing protein [Anaerolineae bacterium]